MTVCQRHMTQLRQDYEMYLLNVSKWWLVPTVVPLFANPGGRTISAHRHSQPKHSVLELYGQEIKIFKFGRMPAQVLISRQGIASFVDGLWHAYGRHSFRRGTLCFVTAIGSLQNDSRI